MLEMDYGAEHASNSIPGIQNVHRKPQSLMSDEGGNGQSQFHAAI